MSDSRTAARPEDENAALLRDWAQGDGPRAMRAAIVLLAAQGTRTADIARQLGVSRQTVGTWRRRYATDGIDGLRGRAHTGRPGTLDEAEIILSTLLSASDRRSSRMLARQLGCSHTLVAEVRRRWNLTHDPCAVPRIPLRPALPEGEVWVAGFYLDPHRAVLLLTSRPTPAGRAAPPAPTGPGADPDVLAAVASVLRAAGRPGQPAPRSLANSLAGEASAFDGFLGATRRRHPGASLHAVVLRQSPGDDAHLLGRCERAGVTLHQLPERTTDGAFARAVLALDAARHPESSARVLLDLASALGRYASAPGPSPAPVRWVREPLLTHLGEHNNQGTGRRRPATAGGANQIDLGSFNECVVIETVRLAGSISRGEISERSRLTQQSVSRIVRSLIQRGLLVEDRQRTPAVGKPRSRVRLRDDAAHALGIHVDPEVLTAVLVNLSGRIVARRAERITSDARPGAVVDQIAGLGESVLAQAGRAVGEESFLGVGVATPGPVDTVSGTVLDPPLMSVLRDVPLRSLLERRFACPIVIEKDSSAAAVGERWIGRDHRTRDFVYLYLGTGVGAGLVLNGDIHRGLSANAGEFGQLCAVALGRLDAEGRPEILPECNPAVHLAEPPRPAFGHGTAPTVRQAARAIGRGALAMVDLLDVGLVVVGGPFFTGDAAEIYLTEIERAVNAYPTARRLRRVHVERSVNSSETVAVGAASTIFHATFTPRLRHTAP